MEATEYGLTTQVMRLERFAAKVQEAVEASPRSSLAKLIREELRQLHRDEHPTATPQPVQAVTAA
jgi:hypothetical protein